MGIDPNHYGPYFWATIHFICLGVPNNLTEEQRRGFIDFFNNLHYVIPCASCGEHLKNNMAKIKSIEEALESGNLFNWSVDLHNMVNVMLSKPEISYEDAYTFWKNAPYANFKNQGEAIKTKTVYKEKQDINIVNMFLIFILGLLIGALLIKVVF